VDVHTQQFNTHGADAHVQRVPSGFSTVRNDIARTGGAALWSNSRRISVLGFCRAPKITTRSESRPEVSNAVWSNCLLVSSKSGAGPFDEAVGLVGRSQRTTTTD
jgi:hypothetical protein